MPERLHRPRGYGWQCPENAVYVGRGSKWANPWRFRSRQALARVPALDGSAWEWEDRISAAGYSHSFNHPDGHVTRHDVRYMTLAECNELYRQALTAPTRDIHLGHGRRRENWLTVEDARRELAGQDLVCRCSLRMACHVDILLEVANKPATRPELLERLIQADIPGHLVVAGLMEAESVQEALQVAGRIMATSSNRDLGQCRCGFRAPELGPHPACPIHGGQSVDDFHQGCPP